MTANPLLPAQSPAATVVQGAPGETGRREARMDVRLDRRTGAVRAARPGAAAWGAHSRRNRMRWQEPTWLACYPTPHTPPAAPRSRPHCRCPSRRRRSSRRLPAVPTTAGGSTPPTAQRRYACRRVVLTCGCFFPAGAPARGGPLSVCATTAARAHANGEGRGRRPGAALMYGIKI